ncbi:hypothetical protein LSH36_951g00001 [Paralvinella palmiformis]|uniref:Protein kinase domain-containing protein n=1 Tax=Paralvinella palmiformis TaxID=53620 RepID=A0AAD9IXR8_9ANNE|nr:hypothetical protein LSH36_951g00001 [Paralvinella palmiformis]
MARVHLFLHRSVTLVKIINCIKKPKKCLETNVTVPHDTDPGMLLTRDFTTTIDLVDTDAKKWVFYIWKYKDAELVNGDPDEVEVDIPNFEPYICPHVTSDILFGSLISDGKFYQVWKGRMVRGVNDYKDVAIKTDKGCNEGYIRYLYRQGESLNKLRNHDYIIDCLGTTPDYRFLMMELSPVGNLKQYVEAKTKEGTFSLPRSPPFEFNLINQIYLGVEAVHFLSPPSLFYCLCASNVIMSGDGTCKLSGFANWNMVRHREEWEEKNRLPRPIQWLSPEAIRLKHTYPSDIWSFGIVMWEIFSPGQEPFQEFSRKEIRQRIFCGQKLHKPIKCSNKIQPVDKYRRALYEVCQRKI